MTKKPAPSLSRLPAKEALPELFEQTGDKIFRLGLKLCGEEAAAEDLVQDTFLLAYRNWEQFQGRSDPSTWLYSIATRACRRRLRRRAGEPLRIESLDQLLPSGQPWIAEIPVLGEDPLALRLHQEAAEVVDRALPQLPLRFRFPLVLKEIAGLSLGEIAEILDLKAATVKTRIHRGRLALRQALARSLPRRPSQAAAHPRNVCLELLRGKMDALDRGVSFQVPEDELCSRCQAFFQSLDLTVAACRWVKGGSLPAKIRDRLRAELARP